MKTKKQAYKLCKYCGCPMKPKGVKKQPDEYDHAQGCPYAKPTDKQRLDWMQRNCARVAGMLLTNGSSNFNVCPYRTANWTRGHKTLRAAIDDAMKRKDGK